MSSFWGSSKPAAAAEPQPEIVKVPAVNVEETIKDFPADLAATLDAKIEELYTLLSPNTPGLEQFLDKDGLTAKKRVVVKDALNLVHVRAEYTFPYNIVDVFGVLTNSADQLLTDSMKKEQSKLKVISKHSWIEYFAIKGVIQLYLFLIKGYTYRKLIIALCCVFTRSGPSAAATLWSLTIGDFWKMDLYLWFSSQQLLS